MSRLPQPHPSSNFVPSFNLLNHTDHNIHTRVILIPFPVTLNLRYGTAILLCSLSRSWIHEFMGNTRTPPPPSVQPRQLAIKRNNYCSNCYSKCDRGTRSMGSRSYTGGFGCKPQPIGAGLYVDPPATLIADRTLIFIRARLFYMDAGFGHHYEDACGDA
jgi:hypothetical protein